MACRFCNADTCPGCPSPAEIKRLCEAIQLEWSEAERWRRAGHADGKRPRWTPPGVVSAIDVPRD